MKCSCLHSLMTIIPDLNPYTLEPQFRPSTLKPCVNGNALRSPMIERSLGQDLKAFPHVVHLHMNIVLPGDLIPGHLMET
eukprot:5814212-Amphidinium_carterae.1